MILTIMISLSCLFLTTLQVFHPFISSTWNDSSPNYLTPLQLGWDGMYWSSWNSRWYTLGPPWMSWNRRVFTQTWRWGVQEARYRQPPLSEYYQRPVTTLRTRGLVVLAVGDYSYPLKGPEEWNKKKLNSVAYSPQANYTDRAAAAC
jgi:hypothetical protein